MSTPQPTNDVVSSLWFKYHTTLESTLMQDATALQIAMRNLLRDRYWLTDCQPLGPVAVNNIRKRMARTNARDVITDEEVNELLCPEFGFTKQVSADGEFMGWHMPGLAEQRGVLLDARTVERDKKRAMRVKQTAPGVAIKAPSAPTRPHEYAVSPAKGSNISSGEDFAAHEEENPDF